MAAIEVTKRLVDFVRFARAQKLSGDLDPTYWVLRESYKGLGSQQALWRTVLYVTWYSLGSAEWVWKRYSHPCVLSAVGFPNLPTGVERRGFRGNVAAAIQHVNAFFAKPLCDLSPVDRHENWDRAIQWYSDLPGGGPWSAYKFADMLKNVHGRNMSATSIGVGGMSKSAGPVPGMVLLVKRPWEECARNVELQRELLELSNGMGAGLGGLDELETALCDFNSLCKGRYYVGHDIDLQMEHLRTCGPDLWEARQKVFDPRWLGEVSGWFGVRKELRALYRDRGVIHGADL